jgi:hypothetical protein
VFGRDTIKDYNAYWQRRRAIEADLIQAGEEDCEPPLCVRLLHETGDAFKHEGLMREDAEARAWEYFAKGDHSNIPFLHLDALLSAALAWQYANQRSSELGQGTTNDLAAIKYFLPYCDAIYVDNAMRALLTDVQVARELKCDARVFSRKTCGEFIAYVEGLIASAPAPHLARVRRVYGEDWGEPFTGMYEPRKE